MFSQRAFKLLALPLTIELGSTPLLLLPFLAVSSTSSHK
jgi:hypothetical protein